VLKYHQKLLKNTSTLQLEHLPIAHRSTTGPIQEEENGGPDFSLPYNFPLLLSFP